MSSIPTDAKISGPVGWEFLTGNAWMPMLNGNRNSPYLATVMNYPLQQISFGENQPLFIPDPKQLKPVYEAALAQDASTAFPYWARVWPSALALTEWLQVHPEYVSGKSVLEVGAGIGLPAFSITTLAASVVVSDHDPDAVALMEENIQHLGLHNTQAMLLDWNDIPQSLQADTVLLSDVNYEPAQFDVLLRMFKRFMDAGTVLILASPQRITTGVFAEALEPYIKENSNHHASGTDVFIAVLTA
jgi:methyltransferase-like protein 23